MAYRAGGRPVSGWRNPPGSPATMTGAGRPISAGYSSRSRSRNSWKVCICREAAEPIGQSGATMVVHRFCLSRTCDTFPQAVWQREIRAAIAKWTTAGANFQAATPPPILLHSRPFPESLRINCTLSGFFSSFSRYISDSRKRSNSRSRPSSRSQTGLILNSLPSPSRMPMSLRGAQSLQMIQHNES